MYATEFAHRKRSAAPWEPGDASQISFYLWGSLMIWKDRNLAGTQPPACQAAL